MSEIVVVGWVTLDFIAHVDGFPSGRVAAVATEFDAACGGRAANQAMAVSAVDGDVALLARLGGDQHASVLQEELLELGVSLDMVANAPAATGMRMVTQRPDAQQQVVVHPGANEYLTVDDLNRNAVALGAARVVGVTTEPAGAVVLRALEIGRQQNVATVLTHHAGAQVSDRVLAAADVVLLSEATCAGLLDPGVTRDQPELAARALCQRGATSVVLLTRERALLVSADGGASIPTPEPLDSEDAVDAFAAGLLTALAANGSLEQSVERGVRTAGLLVD